MKKSYSVAPPGKQISKANPDKTVHLVSISQGVRTLDDRGYKLYVRIMLTARSANVASMSNGPFFTLETVRNATGQIND